MNAVQYHGGLAEDWEQRYGKRSFQVRKDALGECLGSEQSAGSLWLDAGCGTGTLSRVLAERGCRVLGIDGAPAMVERARSLAEKSAFSALLTFRQADDISRLEFADNSFDGVLCSSVLEYLAGPDACLAEFARVLAPNGLLIVSVPNRESLTRRLQVTCRSLGKQLGRDWFKYLDISKNWYSVEDFRRRLQLCGLINERVVIFGGPFSRRIQQWPIWGSLMMFAARKK